MVHPCFQLVLVTFRLFIGKFQAFSQVACLIGLSPMGMSSVKQGMRFGWNVKNFAQNLLIIPRSTQRAGQSTANSERLTFVGGEGGG